MIRPPRLRALLAWLASENVCCAIFCVEVLALLGLGLSF